MVALEERIENDFKQAMRAKDELGLATLRMLKSACKNKTIELRKPELSEPELMGVIQKELKKRQDSIVAFSSAGRQDLADKEKAEANLLALYLPAQLSEAELEKIVEQAIAEQGKNFGPVMKTVMTRSGGTADGQLVQRLVKTKLGL